MRGWTARLLGGIAACALAMTYSPNPMPAQGASGSAALNANVLAFRGQGQLAYVSAGRLYVLDGNGGALRVMPGRDAHPGLRRVHGLLADGTPGAHRGRQ